MPGRVERSELALEDLEEQATYLAEEASLEVALRFLEAAEKAFAHLAQMPEMAPVRQFLNPTLGGLRMWPMPDFPNHLIFYTCREDRIDVVRVLHAKRDIGSIFDEDA